MKGKIIVCSIIVAIVSVCAIGYYVYDSSEETQKVKKHKKRVDYSYANQTNGEGAEDAHVSDVKTFTVNGVSFNMKFVYVGDSYFVIGSNIRGTGFRNSRFDVDHTEIEQEESEDSESEVSDNERDSDSEGESDSNEESDSENEDTDYRAGMSDGYDEWADYDEGPLHEASLSNPEFYMGETEVTVALWDAVMGDSVSKYVSPNFPITRVSWYDCCLFIDKLNKATGLKFRLPTETEWEFAACGGRVNDGYHRFSGSDDCTEVAWYTENSEDSIHEVASLQPNALGLYDMSGNVWEWCLDYYKDDYYYLCKHTDPLCQFDTKEKVLRGGSYLEPIQRVRSEQKKGRALNYYNEDCGFRLFLQLDSKDVYENICETDLKLYEYIPIYKYYKAEVEKTQPLRVRKDTIEDGIRYTINDDYSFVMKKVEGGVFSMGNPIEKRKVRLTYDYYISEVEVTNGLYNLVNRLSFERNEEQRPVVTISYGQVCDFIKTLNNATGETFRLPTEAEWEFAAQGGNKSKSYTYSGTNNIKEVVTQRVGDVKQHNPNELGLYDMSGNVWEFCLDYYEEDFRKYLPNINPIGCPFATTTVIAKGGGADEDDIKNGSIYTSYSKIALDRIFQVTNVGFRLCLSSFKPDYNAYFADIKPNKISGDNCDIYRLNENVSFKMINLKAGMFTKIANDENRKAQKIVCSENAYINEAFTIGETEVTQELFYAVMQYNPSPVKNPKGPVSNVTWNEANSFIEKLNELFNEKFRLPTEYEWEYAAKGGKFLSNYLFSGSNNLNEVAWYGSNAGLQGPHTVATKKPNEIGLYDMSGNVCEWCSNKNKNNEAVYLGGSVYSDMNGCTFINRKSSKVTEKYTDLGFRLAR